ncbi:FixH family protein [Aliikangiella marina]|uniref:FixH family protein n=1 Tax=Aliikangiella marina TaxID=1712262 RepID=A0A545T347_9GAMM|nr:FixH family protein [Aliikangiella marina]TQV71643.1 FixH family protein [Aliikangiella marina]
MTEEQQTSWFKQPWAWFVFAIPLLTVVAGIATLMIAADKPHSMVQDDYFKKGLAINQSLAKQEKAVELKLKVSLSIESENGLMNVNFDGSPISANQIKLIFSHPTKESFDRIVTLDKLSDNQYIGPSPELSDANWYVRMLDIEESWLLKGRWSIPSDNEITLDASKE